MFVRSSSFASLLMRASYWTCLLLLLWTKTRTNGYVPKPSSVAGLRRLHVGSCSIGKIQNKHDEQREHFLWSSSAAAGRQDRTRLSVARTRSVPLTEDDEDNTDNNDERGSMKMTPAQRAIQKVIREGSSATTTTTSSCNSPLTDPFLSPISAAVSPLSTIRPTTSKSSSAAATAPATPPETKDRTNRLWRFLRRGLVSSKNETDEMDKASSSSRDNSVKEKLSKATTTMPAITTSPSISVSVAKQAKSNSSNNNKTPSKSLRTMRLYRPSASGRLKPLTIDPERDFDDWKESIYQQIETIQRTGQQIQTVAETALDTVQTVNRNLGETLRSMRNLPDRLQQSLVTTRENVNNTIATAIQISESVQQIPSKLQDSVKTTRQQVDGIRESVNGSISSVKVVLGLEKPKELPKPPPKATPPSTTQVQKPVQPTPTQQSIPTTTTTTFGGSTDVAQKLVTGVGQGLWWLGSKTAELALKGLGVTNMNQESKPTNSPSASNQQGTNKEAGGLTPLEEALAMASKALERSRQAKSGATATKLSKEETNPTSNPKTSPEDLGKAIEEALAMASEAIELSKKSKRAPLPSPPTTGARTTTTLTTAASNTAVTATAKTPVTKAYETINTRGDLSAEVEEAFKVAADAIEMSSQKTAALAATGETPTAPDDDLRKEVEEALKLAAAAIELSNQKTVEKTSIIATEEAPTTPDDDLSKEVEEALKYAADAIEFSNQKAAEETSVTAKEQTPTMLDDDLSKEIEEALKLAAEAIELSNQKTGTPLQDFKQ